MVKRRPKQSGQAVLNDLNPFLEHARDNPPLGVWLHPYADKEPSFAAWIDAFKVFDDAEQKGAGRLVALLRSDHPLKHYARRYLIAFLDRYQEPAVHCPEQISKLKSDVGLSRDDRSALADLLEGSTWTRTRGNRPPAYEETAAEIELAEASAAIYALVDQSPELAERLDQWKAQGLTLAQAIDKEGHRSWTVKDGTDYTAPDRPLRDVVDELVRNEGLTIERAVTRLTRSNAHRWTVDEAVTRLSELCGMSDKTTATLRTFCNGTHRSHNLRRRFFEGLEK